MNRRRICAVTGSRAEYGLLSPLLKSIAADPDVALQLVATGTHLNAAFGETVKEIETDGLTVDRTCDMLLSSDSPVGVTKSMGLALIGFADIFSELQPDIVLVLGDRFEIFCAAAAAFMARLPVAHLHGGETTQGALDEGLRHAITKMSRLHFTSTEAYRKRVIQLGESPESVFNVGALGVEAIGRTVFPSKAVLARSIGFSLDAPFVVVTYHPETIGVDDPLADAQCLLDVLDGMPDIRVIFTGTNADAHGRRMNRMIQDFVAGHKENTVFLDSMGWRNYLAAVRHAAAVVGNSSSGIIEVPSMGVPTVNIGNRQRGRLQPDSVINCPAERAAVADAILHAISPDFRSRARRTANPYEQPDTADRILSILKGCSLTHLQQGKAFIDATAASPERR